ncbi:hypothetical protein PZA11_007404 [Diplocarpon coronariae]
MRSRKWYLYRSAGRKGEEGISFLKRQLIRRSLQITLSESNLKRELELRSGT